MQYIIIDLEWNQPISFQSHAYREVGDKLIFEMIQIGAVKLDANYKVCDELSVLIKPKHYRKIHPRIKRMTGFGEKELEDAPDFLEAMEQFSAWCGEDCTLLTWGCDDISVLQQNVDFFQYKGKIPTFCDIQRLFSDTYQCKDRKGLKAAMEMLEIEPDEEKTFHNAVYDAYYTGLVFGKLPDPEKVLEYPQKPKQLIHQDRVEKARGKTTVYDNVMAALHSEEAISPICPQCGKPAQTEGEYVRQTADKYIGLANCKTHGSLLCKARLHGSDDGKCHMAITVSRAAPSNRAYVHTKQLQVEMKNAEWLETHESLPDPDEELRAAERTNMPFDD